jgi:hypothetical protein
VRRVELGLSDGTDERVVRAARAAVARERLDAAPSGVPARPSAWWLAGLREGVDRGPAASRPEPYEAARSPRSTRGAMRA